MFSSIASLRASMLMSGELFMQSRSGQAATEEEEERDRKKLQKRVSLVQQKHLSRCDGIKMQATCALRCHKDQALCAKHLELCAARGGEGKSLSHFTSFPAPSLPLIRRLLPLPRSLFGKPRESRFTTSSHSS
jgi:hypothetical protein